MIEFALYNTVVLSSLNPLNADFSLTGGGRGVILFYRYMGRVIIYEKGYTFSVV